MTETQLLDVGLIGLAVMGQNLVLNMNDHGYSVIVYNRTYAKTEEFLETSAQNRSTIVGAQSLQEFVRRLKRPRKIILLVKAGEAVDATIDSLLPLLETGDIVVDAGNSHYADTERREAKLRAAGLLFVGSGISGGEEGARHGPSLMPGGNVSAWEHLRPIFESVAAKVNSEPCVAWIGDGGAGHFVKMVHNGIEYGDMQIIAEVYHFMRDILQLSPEAMSHIFSQWNTQRLESYLIEITAQILKTRDSESPHDMLIDKILDAAEQKGTGKWTVAASLDESEPVTLIAEAVFARQLSAARDLRQTASKILPAATFTNGIEKQASENLANMIHDLEKALYAAKIISYAQGFSLMRKFALSKGWKLEFATIARIWRGGCIIRSKFLNAIAEAFSQNPNLESLLFAPFFVQSLRTDIVALRRIISLGVTAGIPMPSLSASLAYFDGLRSDRLPANLIQAQRDFFGAHTYERIDKPRGMYFHTEWKNLSGS